MNENFDSNQREKDGVQEPRDRAEAELLRGVTEQLLKESEAREQELAKIEKEADLDHLTGLLNRRGFKKKLAEMREEGTTGALLLLDIDRFKEINDAHGHTNGDLVLKAVARHLKTICRESDLTVRWSGDEFILFFPDTTADQILKKFTSEASKKAAINVQFTRRGEPETSKINITFSGGVVDLGLHADENEAVGRADRTLYDVKDAGRNEIKVSRDGSGEEK